MTVLFNAAKAALFKGDLDLDTAVVKAALLMSSNTLGTSGQEDAAHVSDLTLDECDSAGYARITVASQAVSQDNTGNRAEFTFDPLVWAALPSCSRACPGMLLFQFITDDAASIPIAYVTFGSSLVPNGGDITITPDAAGALQLT